MTDVAPETEEEETVPETRSPMPGEYVDPQPVAVDIDGDEAVGVAPETDVEAMVATIQAELDRSRSRIAELTSGMDADTAWKYLAKIDAAFVALDRLSLLRPLLLRAEEERDEWRRKAKIDEEQATDRLEDWQVAHDHALRMQARALRAEEVLARRDDYSRKTGCDCHEDESLRAQDPDYSPAYQDEYQRLWHEAQAKLLRAEEERDEGTSLGFILRENHALRRAASQVLHEYDLWAEDANDGEFAIWSRDEFMASFMRLRAALATPEETKEAEEAG